MDSAPESRIQIKSNKEKLCLRIFNSNSTNCTPWSKNFNEEKLVLGVGPEISVQQLLTQPRPQEKNLQMLSQRLMSLLLTWASSSLTPQQNSAVSSPKLEQNCDSQTTVPNPKCKNESRGQKNVFVHI